VSLTEHNFAATQPLRQAPDVASPAALPASGLGARSRNAFHRPPLTLIGTLSRLTRANAAVAVTIPPLCGAVLAWWEGANFSPLAFGFTLLGALTMTLGMNALYEHYDFTHARQSASAPELHPNPEPVMTGYGLMVNRIISAELGLNLGYFMLVLSLLCTLWLTLLAGWPVLFFSGLSFILAYAYATPPIYYGYRGWGLGEIGLFFAYGLLPVLNGYFTQSQTLTLLSLWVSMPLGLFSALLFFNYNLIYEYRDWLMHKRTLVVNLGAARALDVGAIAVVIIYTAILSIVSIAHLPLITLVTLATLPTALGGFSRLRTTQVTVEDRFLLYCTTVNAAAWTGLLFAAALFVDKWF